MNALSSVTDKKIQPLIKEWNQLRVRLEADAAREKELREIIANKFCPSREEGANKLLTTDGFEVTVTQHINRTLDVAALDSVMEQVPKHYRQPGVLIDWKPALVLKAYRELPPEVMRVFAQVVTEKPGLPSLEIEKIKVDTERSVIKKQGKKK